MRVAARDVGVARVLRVAADRLVERHPGQRARVDRREELVAVLQVLRALGRSGRVAREIVERLVVRLEVRARGLAVVDDRAFRLRILPAVRERRVPAARVPRPRDALRGERVADGLRRLRRHRMARRIGEVGRAARGGRHAGGLVGRLRRVDRIAVGRHRAVGHLHRPVEHRAGRAGTAPEATVRVELRAHRRRRVAELRRARADEPEVVQERAAERSHEEVVGERVLARPLPQLHRRAVVVAHHPRPDVAGRDEPVVRAARDLLLVLPERVDRARHELVGRHADRRRVDRERAVGQAIGEARVRLAAGAPHRRQVRERLAVVVELRRLQRRRLRDAVGAGKQAVQVVEAVVLRVDHDDRVDAVESRAGGRTARSRARGGERGGGRERCDESHASIHRPLLLRVLLTRARRSRERRRRARVSPRSRSSRPASRARPTRASSGRP